MVDLADRPEEQERDPLTGLWNHDSIATIEPDVAVAYFDILHFRDRVNRPYGHAVGDRVLRAVAHRLQDRLAPYRVFRLGGDEFVVEILEPLDWIKAVEWASRIKRLVEAPIEGIDEPLEAHIGIAFGCGSHTSLMAEMAGDRASGLDLPFLVDDGVGNRLDPWEPWWRALVSASAQADLLPDHPWLLETPRSARAVTEPGRLWVVGADLVVSPSWDGRPFVTPLNLRAFIRLDGRRVASAAVAGLVVGRAGALELIPAGTTLRLVEASGWDDRVTNSVGSCLRFCLPDGRTMTVDLDERSETSRDASDWRTGLTWRRFACAAALVPDDHPWIADPTACEAALASIESAAIAADRRARS